MNERVNGERKRWKEEKEMPEGKKWSGVKEMERSEGNGAEQGKPVS